MKMFITILIFLVLFLPVAESFFWPFDSIFGRKKTELKPHVESETKKGTVNSKSLRPSPQPSGPVVSRVKQIGYAVPKRQSGSSITPTKHSFEEVFLKRMKESVVRFGHIARVVFIGDAILYKFSKDKSVWEDWEPKYAPVMLACPGDKTENILHRFKNHNDLLGNITTNPLVVVMVGSSNVVAGDNADDIFLGISAVLNMTKAKLPKSKFLLLGLLPRTSKVANETVITVNKKLAKLHSANIHFLDISKYFYNATTIKGHNTTYTVNKKLFASEIFPSIDGYNLIAKHLRTEFAELLGSTQISRPLPPSVKNISAHHRHPSNRTAVPWARPNISSNATKANGGIAKGTNIKAVPSAANTNSSSKGTTAGKPSTVATVKVNATTAKVTGKVNTTGTTKVTGKGNATKTA